MDSIFPHENKLIKKQGRNYKKKFITITNLYSNILQQSLFFTDSQYTPHDFKNHVKNILCNVDMLTSEKAYSSNDINHEGAFLLCMSILLHDLWMIIGDENERGLHARLAADHMRHRFMTFTENDLEMKTIITPNYAHLIAYIISGHSDEKLQDGKIHNSIPTIPEMITGTSGPVKVRLLAALLRIADELDVGTKRIKGNEHMLKKVTSPKSKECWRQDQLFLGPQIDPDFGSTIFLEVNDSLIAASNYDQSDVFLMKERKQKIQNELDMLNREVFDRRRPLADWAYNKIEIKTNDPKLKHLLEAEVTSSSPSPHIHSSEYFVELSSVTNPRFKRVYYDTVSLDLEQLRGAADMRLLEKLKKKAVWLSIDDSGVKIREQSGNLNVRLNGANLKPSLWETVQHGESSLSIGEIVLVLRVGDIRKAHNE